RITPTRHAAISWMPGRLLATADPLNETPLHELARLTSTPRYHRRRHALRDHSAFPLNASMDDPRR
ncbi:hypothetical protein WH47_02801, partial [Habropoda laboriosa]